MNEKIWWYLARGSGIVALVLLVASVVLGVALATRILEPHDRPAWLLDLHRWLAGSALVMTGLHLVGLMLDGYIDYGFADVLVPGASAYRPVAVAIGVFSLYAMVAVQVTSYLRRWLSRRVWHGIHMLSYLVVWAAALHAGLAGTDVTNRAYQALALVLTVAAVAAALVRVLTPGRRSERAAAGSRPQDELASADPEMTAV